MGAKNSLASQILMHPLASRFELLIGVFRKSFLLLDLLYLIGDCNDPTQG